VLYLPPLWFHETLALSEDGVVSVNGWVECDEGAAAAELLALQLPGRLQEEEDGALAAASLVMLLSSTSFGNASVLPARVWLERYATIVEDGSLPTQGEAGSGGSESGSSGGKALAALDCTSLAALRERWGMTSHGLSWARAATRLAAARFSDQTRASWLGNLAEFVAAQGVGVRSVGGFWRSLYSCVDSNDGGRVRVTIGS